MQTQTRTEKQDLRQISTSEAPPASEVLFDDLTEGEEEGASPITLTVAEAEGERLDKWLAGQLLGHSRSAIQRWIEAGEVTLRGQPLKASYRVVAGDEITVFVPEPTDYTVQPEPIPLDVLYEDDDLLLINKPAGMVVHPAAGNLHGTLVNAVLYHCPTLAGVGGTRRPGIVHRLDRDTSGLILVAKNDRAHRALQAQFKERRVLKTYLALVYGQVIPAHGQIAEAIGRDTRHRQRMAVVPPGQGRPAVTTYETIAVYRAATGERLTLLACRPLTGRTHQIRVHLAHLKHPVVGDAVYGHRRKAPVPCPRQFLHAHGLTFELPATGQRVTFTAPLPADLEAVLATLRRNTE